MYFTYKKIKDIFDIRKGKKLSEVINKTEKSIRYIQIDDLRNDLNIKYCEIDEKNVIVNKNDIIIAWDGANAGTIGYGLEGGIGSTLAALKSKEYINCQYIGKYLKSKEKYLRSQCTGATIPHISRSILENLKIPLPPLETQQKIADVLDKAQELIDKRKEQIKKLDEFIQSVFLDMFDKNFGTKISLSEVCIINPPKSEIKNLPINTLVSFIPMMNVSETGRINLEEKRSLNEVYSSFTYFIDNDVLFAKITPCMENGKGAIAKNLTNGIGFGSTEFHVLRPKQTIVSEWLYRLISLEVFRNEAHKNMTGSAGQKRVPKSFFYKYKVSVPPIDLQNQFATIVEKTEQQKELMQKSLTQMENNFNSLMQRAFKGELFNN